MTQDKDLEAFFDSLAEAEREGYEKGLGEGLLASVSGAEERREKGDRAVLDILHRASQPTEPGDDA
jgi:hypothetical protein